MKKLDENTKRELRRFRKGFRRNLVLVPPLVTLGDGGLTLHDESSLGESDSSLEDRGFKIGQRKSRGEQSERDGWSLAWKKHLDRLQEKFADCRQGGAERFEKEELVKLYAELWIDFEDFHEDRKLIIESDQGVISDRHRAGFDSEDSDEN